MNAVRFISLAMGLLLMACFLSVETHAAAPDSSASFVDVLRQQVSLDRAGFSPGLIDGKPGRKTRLALDALRRTGVDPASLESALSCTKSYTLTIADMADVGPWPEDWNERAALDRLRYESLISLLAERGHCTAAMLTRLNPSRDLNELKAGDTVTIPNVLDLSESSRAARLVINLDEKTVTAMSEDNKPIAFMHCSIAKLVEKRPSGATTVKVIVLNPTYTFDPAMWPEVTNVTTKLTIPAGPRCPVGLAWIGLNLPGYGIHGTPWPQLIGKTGSHGCFRLANWDAVRLAKMVKVGTRVEFIGGGGVVAAERGGDATTVSR